MRRGQQLPEEIKLNDFLINGHKIPKDPRLFAPFVTRWPIFNET
jgi:hypothetical protein